MKTMKRKMGWAVLATSLLVGCGGQTGYRVEGEMKGLEGEVYLNIDGVVTDTASVDGGKFVFKGDVEQPAVAVLMSDEGPITSFFLENGKISLKGDVENVQEIEISGTLSNDRYSEIQEKMREYVDRYVSASSEADKQAAMASFDSLLWASIDVNRDNILGVALLCQAAQSENPDRVLAAIETFSPDMQAHPMMEETDRMARTAMNTAVGQPYTEITLSDTEGKEIALSALVGPGKYVLLDFWASWCGPCREEFPYLIDAYKKYHKKGFDIYGVSLDQDREAWLKAVEHYGLVWTNVAAKEGEPNGAAVSYGINSIPANFLIAPDGKIVARDLRGEALEEKLFELLD